ncbi:MAG: hypothetical protein R3339_07700 [Thermodesulfobacteriota bacterium]|nr:hypothetical protein [Thermodesulfobacteriota bacterium]
MGAEKLVGVVKWWLIIAVGVLAFYIVYPKYEFDKTGSIRMNTITGKAEKKLDKYGNTEVLWEANRAHILF